MAASAENLTPGDYIAHHLTNLRITVGEGGFWTLNLDSIIMGWLVGIVGIGAFYLIAFAFVVHTIGLGFRMWLEGRPPVTNLYSSAVFIGWACVPLALLAEWFSRTGILSIAASLMKSAILSHALLSSSNPPSTACSASTECGGSRKGSMLCSNAAVTS